MKYLSVSPRRMAARALAAGCSLLLAAGLVTAPAAYANEEPARPAFYESPQTLPTENGAVIRSESMTYRLDPHRINEVYMNSWRVLYKSTNRSGEPIAVSGTIMVPRTAWLGISPRPIIGYAVGTQGLADRCAPSRQFSEGLEYEGLFITGLLKRGYAIAMTDYEGLGTEGVHTYMDRQSQGQTVLDAVRAAQRLDGSGLSIRNPVGLQGYSQGGGAAAAAAELASTYAPDLQIKGASVGAVPADLRRVAEYIDGGNYTEFVLYAAAGLNASYDVDVTSITNELGTQKFADIVNHCVGDATQNAGVKTRDLTASGLSLPQEMQNEPFRSMVADQQIGNRKPAFPVLVTHSLLDDTIPYDQGRAMAKSWCRNGANVRLSTNATPTHVGGMLNTSAEMYAFFEARFAGFRQVSSCWRL